MPVKASREQAKLYQLNLDGGADEVKAKKPRNDEEARSQDLLFQRRDELKGKYPVLRWLFGTFNGIFIPMNLRQQMVRAGLTKGVPDVWFPVPYIHDGDIRYCGLIMDLKTKKNRPTAEQSDWATMLREAGFLVLFPVGAVEAWHCLCCYAGISGPDHWAADLAHQIHLADIIADRK